jgi:hypothetical protein
LLRRLVLLIDARGVFAHSDVAASQKNKFLWVGITLMYYRFIGTRANPVPRLHCRVAASQAGLPGVRGERSSVVHFLRIGNRALNLDRISHCEVQVWHDSVSVKIFMSGTTNNTPVVLNEEEAKQFWKYIEHIGEKPVKLG